MTYKSQQTLDFCTWLTTRMVGQRAGRKRILIAAIISLKQRKVQSFRNNSERRQNILSEGSVYNFVHELKGQNCTV
jgi:hypothetical protein